MADATDAAPFDKLALRNALGRFATGVTIVTTSGRDGRPVGLTANSFSSLSLDPPLVLWSIDKGSSCLKAFEKADGFVVHVLSTAQETLSTRFAALPLEDRFTDLDYGLNDRGLPLLDGACARFECRTDAIHEGGDHLILVGAVEAMDVAETEPLVFWSGQYRGLNSASPETI